ncbi:MAG: LUD domain-containing protein [Clostridiales bacterium]|jgi:L-lactate utilization protein LutB|nr:LUD domain-containing protein [Clostridiales bacterium]
MNIENAVKNLKNRGFDVSVFGTKEDARDYLVGKLKGRSIGFGGSVTLKQMGLFEALSKENTVWNHWIQEPLEARKNAAKADVYITSANGVAETGEIINIDGSGNRVSATLYGKEEVYFIVGINKFADNFDKALWRARNIAGPKNAQRLGRKTPCAKEGDKCYDCSSPERICKGLVVLWGKTLEIGRMEIVIVNECLGY